MKIAIVTTPIRPTPTYFPPFGSLAIIQALRRIGEKACFYHIDFHRYPPAEVERYFTQNQFDIVGISSVVSTAYAYTQFLGKLIRRVSPKTVVIVGGNLAASAEILLRKSEVDYCVAGDGENIIQELVATLRDHGRDLPRLREIRGISFLEEDGRFHFTGYGLKPSAEEIEDPDYSILEEAGCLDHYLPIVDNAHFDSAHGEKFGPGRSAVVVMSKGCVSRCTFCHRWEKGYRAVPEDKVVNLLRFLKEKHQVRYINLADENFGSDKEHAHELASSMGELGLVWNAGGVRATSVTPEILAHWRRNGCINVTYGNESGSPTILKVMEKGVTAEQNIKALQWTYEAGLKTAIQLVLGMPGETDKTIGETTEFVKKALPYLYLKNDLPSSMLSLNYAQALPGTPLYEYARQHGFIGRDVDEEERYLIRISDTDAYKEDHFINYTGLPLLKVLMWQQEILAAADAHYLTERYGTRYSLFFLLKYYLWLAGSRLAPGLFRLRAKAEVQRAGNHEHLRDSGYFNIRDASKFTPLLLNPVTRSIFTPLLAAGMAFGKKHAGPSSGLRLFCDYAVWRLKGSPIPLTDMNPASLRKTVQIVSHLDASAEDKMLPLRTGR